MNEHVRRACEIIAREMGAPLRIERTMTGAWEVYIPKKPPCICNNFEEAAEMMREYLKRKRRAATRRPMTARSTSGGEEMTR